MKSKWTQIKTKHNYDSWTKQLSNKIEINNVKHISKLKPKVVDVPSLRLIITHEIHMEPKEFTSLPSRGWRFKTCSWITYLNDN